MYLLAVAIVLVLVVLSAWFVGQSSQGPRGTRVGAKLYANFKIPEPPWQVGTVVATVALVIFILLGVFASYVVVGKDANWVASLIIAVLLAGTTYFSRAEKDKVDIGDFFTCFSQGFTWPTALPKLAEFLGAPVITAPAIVTPTPGALLHMVAPALAAVVQPLLALLT